MNDSILDSVKKIIGISPDYYAFDQDIIMHINSVFMVLRQLGIGPTEGFSISNRTSTWSDYISDMSLLEAVKTYVGLKVRLIFDPPTNSTLLQAISNNVSELEWRLNVEVDPGQAVDNAASAAG